MQTRIKRHTRANSLDVFLALDFNEFSLSPSPSLSSCAVLPIGVEDRKHAPLIDGYIARMLSEVEDVKKSSPSFRTTRIRGENNNRNGFVSALRCYPIQTVFARYVTMYDLETVACTSSAISNSLNLKETREMWETKIKNGRGDKARKATRRESYYKALENMPEPRKRTLDGDEQVAYVPSWRPQSWGPKRVKAVSGHV
jgi:hypothetical protein